MKMLRWLVFAAVMMWAMRRLLHKCALRAGRWAA
jgi:hypothetical protein